jgi:hypothetical protein
LPSKYLERHCDLWIANSVNKIFCDFTNFRVLPLLGILLRGLDSSEEKQSKAIQSVDCTAEIAASPPDYDVALERNLLPKSKFMSLLLQQRNRWEQGRTQLRNCRLSTKNSDY